MKRHFFVSANCWSLEPQRHNWDGRTLEVWPNKSLTTENPRAMMARCRYYVVFSSNSWLGCTTLVGKALSFTHCFFVNPLCSAAMQWMAIKCISDCGGSVVGKASTVGIGISLTPHIIFTVGQKVRNLVSFKISLNFEPPAFEYAARYSNYKTKMQCCDDRPMFSPSLVKLGPRTPEKALSILTHPLKLHATMR